MSSCGTELTHITRWAEVFKRVVFSLILIISSIFLISRFFPLVNIDNSNRNILAWLNFIRSNSPSQVMMELVSTQVETVNESRIVSIKDEANGKENHPSACLAGG